MNLKKIVQIVCLSADDSGCRFCSDFSKQQNDFQSSINHHIDQHGFKLLHVGSESSLEDGGLYHSTIAVLGSKQKIEEVKYS
jgi:hypothetical protein